MKLVDDQVMDSPWSLASISDEDIAAIYDVICRFNGLMSGKTPDMGARLFKAMEHSSRD